MRLRQSEYASEAAITSDLAIPCMETQHAYAQVRQYAHANYDARGHRHAIHWTFFVPADAALQPFHACKASVCRYGHPLHALAERGASKHLPRLCKHSGGLASPSHLDCSADDVCTYGRLHKILEAPGAYLASA